ncbi:MAG: DNA-directed DNA polymerase I, partial [Candidatus Bathyarchaeia archaeon]
MKLTQKRLDEFSVQETTKPKEKEEETLPFTKILEEERQRRFEAPENLLPSYFVSATYDGKAGKAVIKLYEPVSGRIYFWYDNTGHKPYCYTNLSPLELEKIDHLVKHPGFDHIEIEEKYNPLLDRTVTVTKVVAKDPLAIGGRPKGCIRDIIPEESPKIVAVPAESVKVWEAKIKYYQSYIYDRGLLPGMVYEVKNGNLVQVFLDEAEKMVKQIVSTFKDVTAEELEYIEQWARLLEYPAPRFRYAAIDIEVQSPIPTRMPDPRVAEYPIVCVSVYSSDGQKRVLLLKRVGVREGTERLPADVKMEFYDSEEALIKAVFGVLWDYPFIITFNGDDFDLRYLAHRAEKFGFKRDKIPIELGKRVCLLKYGVHIDLYKFFFNRSIQIYAFNNRYRDVTLGDVGKALVGLDKILLEKSIGELTYTELAKYCFRDAEIAYKLTSFDDELVLKLILVLARISSMPMEDVSRQGVSRWIRNFMHREHRRKGMLIPNAEDILALKGKTATKAIIKGKKYKGAIVVEPVPGVHFNVAVMDFPSLYPSIIKVWNLGYQSILCSHLECRSNLVPDTPHWVCRKKRALESLLIGALRDLRVYWYKPKSKDKTLPPELRSWYNIIQGALKVILNASYGVFGAETFDLYCPPVAEATAAVGRHSITQIIKKAEELGIQVLYGDTDSVFLKNPTREQIQALEEWAEKTLKMGLDVDKVYRYAVFSSRKKNYLGVLEDGSVDVKGLTGK